MTKKQRRTTEVQSDYQPTKREAAAAQRMIERRAKSTPSPRFKVTQINGKTTIDPDHPDTTTTHVLLADILATGNSVLTEGLLVQLANVAQTDKQLTSIDLNLMVATVKAIRPRDETEALLACQMAAIHTATMRVVRRLNRAETVVQQDSAGNQANKLARTFAAQMEALKRYRSTGEQHIRVQHVTVNEGGQAIVGNVQTRGGGTQKNESQSHAPSGNDERGPPLLSHEQTFGMPLPFAGREGATSVPDARRQGGSTEGQG